MTIIKYCKNLQIKAHDFIYFYLNFHPFHHTKTLLKPPHNYKTDTANFVYNSKTKLPTADRQIHCEKLIKILFETSKHFPIFIFFRKVERHIICNRPLYTDCRVVICNSAFVVWMEEIINFIAEFSIIA